jgi:hypothetical protein
VTIRIIERREPPEKRPFRATCNHCKSVIEFHESDAEYVADFRDSFWRINCPVCFHTVTASSSARANETQYSQNYWDRIDQ